MDHVNQQLTKILIIIFVQSQSFFNIRVYQYIHPSHQLCLIFLAVMKLAFFLDQHTKWHNFSCLSHQSQYLFSLTCIMNQISRNSLCYMLTVIVGKKYYGHMSYDNNCEKMACVKHVKQNSQICFCFSEQQKHLHF